MNYYEHHIGDYAEATAHLSFIEDAAYSRMMRKYYATEKPLPVELASVQRIIGARTRDERNAVEAVLKEFFTLESDGWHQKTCDLVIARYLEKSGKARLSAQSRWSRSHSDGNANASETQCERIQNASTSHIDRNALQSPVSSNQSPVTSKTKSQEGAQQAASPQRPARADTAKRIPDDFGLTPERIAIAQTEKLDADRTFSKFTDYWRAASGAKARKLDWDATWRNWCRSEADRTKPAGRYTASTLSQTSDLPPELRHANG